MRGIKGKGGSRIRAPKARNLGRGGETYIPVQDRGEVNPRCRSCGQVVPLKVWWSHRCLPPPVQEG